jgi:hypothetical protein
MENNRRSFFKGLATFASGIVAAKVAAYTPKKQEDVLVTSSVTINHEGEEYHPLVVKKTNEDGFKPTNQKYFDPHALRIRNTLPKIRKANI